MIRTTAALALSCLFVAGVARGASPDEARALIGDDSFEAAAAMLEGLPDDPAGERATLLAWALAESGDWERALEIGEDAVEKAPGKSEAHFAYALALRHKMSNVGKLRALASVSTYKRELARAIELDPRNVEVLEEEIGYLIHAPGIAGGDKGEAREKIEKLRPIDAARAFFMLAELETAAGNLDAAFDAYRRCLDADPTRRDVRRSYAFALQREKRWREADAQLTLLTEEPAGSRYRLGALYQLGRSRVLGEYDSEGAVDHFDLYLAELPDPAPANLPRSADALWRRGMALEQLGRQSDARDSYRRALAIDPDHEQAKKALRRVR